MFSDDSCLHNMGTTHINNIYLDQENIFGLSNFHLTAAPCVLGELQQTPFACDVSSHMQGQYFQQRSFLGHTLSPSPVFVRSKKDALGLQRYAAYVAIRGFPHQLFASDVNTCHVSRMPQPVVC